MNKQITRTIVGIGIITVGALALLDTLTIIDVSNLFHDWWPLAVILAGVLMLINHPREFLWPIIVISAGILLQLRELDQLSFNPWQLFWPVVIIAVGLSVLINRSHIYKNVSKKDLDDVTVLLGSSSTTSESKNYKGGKISTIMGGADIDLRSAIIKDEATLDIFAFWGGVTLKVPEGWVIKSRITPIAGGIEIKTKSADKDTPILYLTGDVIMSGVEIKHN